MININHATLVGRITKDIELRKTQNNLSVCSFTLAVNRKAKNDKGEYDADFISCIAWRQSAEFLAQYAAKGDMVSVEGSIQTRNYEGRTGRVYVTEVVAESVQLISNRKEEPKEELPADPKYYLEQGEVKETKASEKVNISPGDLPFF